MRSFRLELGPPASWASFFPLDHRGYEIWGPLPYAPPIAASLIIPAIFWGQNYVWLYALIFSVFLFYNFWIFSFSYSLLFLLSFLISSYSSLLISSYSSHRCYSSPLIFQTVCCITDMHINDISCICTVFVHISVILRGVSKRPSLFYLLILVYCTIFFLFLLYSSLLII